MRCIFCKISSTNSRTVEHIVPESLGNKEHVLPKGVVCDKCNNYFATKIEKHALETEFFKNLRFRTGLESKKGRIPPGTVLFPKTGYRGEISFDKDISSRKMNIVVDEETFNLIESGKIKQTYLPFNIGAPKDNQAVSRMLAKIALECMATRFINDDGYLDFLVDEPAFDPIRNYVRFNDKNEIWPYNVRKIYGEDEAFLKHDGEQFDMVFECDFLGTNIGEMYFVIAFKGVEFALNMSGPSVEGYEDWLTENNNISPLYISGKHFGYHLVPQFTMDQVKKGDV